MTNIINLQVKSQDSDQHYRNKGNNIAMPQPMSPAYLHKSVYKSFALGPMTEMD